MIEHSRPTIEKSDFEILKNVLHSSHLSENGLVGNFETKLKNFIGTKFAIATNSGTSALHLTLLGLDIAKGDEVILPSYVCSSVLNAVMYAGAKPVISDIELDTMNMSLGDTRKKIFRKTRAIILPYMFGSGSPDLDKFLELNIPLIEDCAQSLGATYKGSPVGGFGIASIFSFYATKVITTGQGGMILTSSSKIFNKAKDLIEYDKRSDYRIRYNYKMTDIEAALGLAQLKRINSFITRRREIALYYNKAFSKCNILLPIPDRGHIYYRYVIRIKTPINKFIQVLKRKGIETKPPVYKPLHRYLGLDKKLFPNTEEVFKSAISLPIYPALTDNQAKLIAVAVKEAL